MGAILTQTNTDIMNSQISPNCLITKPLFSISEILDQVQEDAEDVLFSLGFGHEDHKDTSRIPARFFTNPSQAKGIDFQLFLKSQMERIEMEDPCLMLASECDFSSIHDLLPYLPSICNMAPYPFSLG